MFARVAARRWLARDLRLRLIPHVIELVFLGLLAYIA
jgi:hypothetical protein